MRHPLSAEPASAYDPISGLLEAARLVADELLRPEGVTRPSARAARLRVACKNIEECRSLMAWRAERQQGPTGDLRSDLRASLALAGE